MKRQQTEGAGWIYVLAFAAALFLTLGTGNPWRHAPAAEAGNRVGVGHSAKGQLILYAGIGDTVTRYDADADRGTLTERGSVKIPGIVGEGWVHPSSKFLYVPWSNGERHAFGLSAFRVDAASGSLDANGDPASLPSSASYVTGDIPGTHLLISYGQPSALTVHRLEPNGAIGAQVEQSGSLDFGNFAHQVRINPANDTVIIMTRGSYTDEQYPNQDSPRGLKISQPGALKVFHYKDGLLSNETSVAENGGYGFQVRHMDFHPSKPWAFVTLEPQNKLYVYKVERGTLSPHPLFMKETLAEPGNVRPMQHAGTLHVHPGGRFVYVANRTNSTRDFRGQPVFAGGENNIAVYAINQETGEPTPIQHIDTQGILPRTFAIDPAGKMLVVAHQTAFAARDGETVRTIPCSLAIFRIGADGKLTFVRKYDLETGGKSMTWNSPQGYTEGKPVSWVELVALR